MLVYGPSDLQFLLIFLQGRKRGKEKLREKQQVVAMEEQSPHLEEVTMVRKAMKNTKEWKMEERQKQEREGRERRATKDQGRESQRQRREEGMKKGQRGVNIILMQEGRGEITGEVKGGGEGEREWRG